MGTGWTKSTFSNSSIIGESTHSDVIRKKRVAHEDLISHYYLAVQQARGSTSEFELDSHLICDALRSCLDISVSNVVTGLFLSIALLCFVSKLSCRSAYLT